MLFFCDEKNPRIAVLSVLSLPSPEVQQYKDIETNLNQHCYVCGWEQLQMAVFVQRLYHSIYNLHSQMNWNGTLDYLLEGFRVLVHIAHRSKFIPMAQCTKKMEINPIGKLNDGCDSKSSYGIREWSIWLVSIHHKIWIKKSSIL